MSLWRRAGHAVAGVLASSFLVAGFSGSTCIAVVCVEDCDPCLHQCLCHTCPHGSGNPQTTHKFTDYRLAVAQQPDGTVVRTISEIVGLSLDFADGPRAHGSADFERFAEGVIEFNGLVLQSRRGEWAPRGVEVFDASVVADFSRPGASLSFLFDRRGNLVEIDEVRR